MFAGETKLHVVARKPSRDGRSARQRGQL